MAPSPSPAHAQQMGTARPPDMPRSQSAVAGPSGSTPESARARLNRLNKSLNFSGSSSRTGADPRLASQDRSGGQRLGTLIEGQPHEDRAPLNGLDHQAQARMDATERDMYAALQASKEEAELLHAARLRSAAEEGRIFNMTIALSAEQSLLQAQRLEEEERNYQDVLRESSKGKAHSGAGPGGETPEERQEREELELVLALSLSEASSRPREGGVGTSAEEFERLSRMDDELATSQYEESASTFVPMADATPASLSLPIPLPVSTSQTFVVQNPDPEEDDEPPPPAYDPLPLESPSMGLVDEAVEPPESLSRQNSGGLSRPGPHPISRRSSSSSYLVHLQAHSNDTARNNRLSTVSNTPRAGSFSTEASYRSNSRASTSSSMSRSRSSSINAPQPVESVAEPIPPAAAAFYSQSVTASMGYAATPVLPLPSNLEGLDFGRSQRRGAATLVSRRNPPPAKVEQAEEEDPFDERVAAIDLEDDGRLSEGEGEGEDEGDDSPAPTSSRLALDMNYYRDTSLDEVSSSPSEEITPHGAYSTHQPNESIASFASSNRISMAAMPTEGGLVDSSSVNAFADAAVLAGVKYDFIPPTVSGSAATSLTRLRSTHPPLELEGPFPDVCQLSRWDGVAKEKFQCFAVEAKSWTGLLTYLMWHGNSRIEAAPRDLAKERSVNGLSCSITLEFFRSFVDGGPRVRLLIELLPPRLSYEATLSHDPPPADFDPECPNITIRIPIEPLLPLHLSNLATTLSNFHATAREAPRRLFPSSTSSFSGIPKALKNLPIAIDLFRSLAGEEKLTFEDREDSEENKLLTQLKGRLRRRKKAPGLVKNGSGAGQAVGSSAGLPEGAILVTPFRLDE